MMIVKKGMGIYFYFQNHQYDNEDNMTILITRPTAITTRRKTLQHMLTEWLTMDSP